jgi:hypothetical protein
MDDDAIRVLVRRLARPHLSGGDVIERSVILAAGSDFTEVIEWITAHAGVPEAPVAGGPAQGLHSPRLTGGDGAEPRTPLRYVLPAGALA